MQISLICINSDIYKITDVLKAVFGSGHPKTDLSREFFKNMAECCYFIKQLLYGFRVWMA